MELTCFSTHITKINYLEKSSDPTSEQFWERNNTIILVTLFHIFYYRDLEFLKRAGLGLLENMITIEEFMGLFKPFAVVLERKVVHRTCNSELCL